MGGLATILNQINLPKIGVGLGYQGEFNQESKAIPEGNWRFVKSILNNKPSPTKPNLALRGQKTFDVINEYGFNDGIVVTGCPSIMLNENMRLGEQIASNFKEKPESIVVAAGSVSHKKLQKLEESMADFITHNNGEYIVQHPESLFYLALGSYNLLSEEAIESWRNYIRPSLSQNDFLLWMQKYSKLHTHVPTWLRSLKYRDMVLGCRIHGTLAGLMAGIPSVCLYIDSRTKELCEQMSIPALNAYDFQDGIDVNEVYSYAKKINWQEFDFNRQNLLIDFNRFFSDQNILQSGKLERMVNSIR